jgi:hypothetical protein
VIAQPVGIQERHEHRQMESLGDKLPLRLVEPTPQAGVAAHLAGEFPSIRLH